jgi:hypothetical protein
MGSSRLFVAADGGTTPASPVVALPEPVLEVTMKLTSLCILALALTVPASWRPVRS